MGHIPVSKKVNTLKSRYVFYVNNQMVEEKNFLLLASGFYVNH